MYLSIITTIFRRTFGFIVRLISDFNSLIELDISSRLDLIYMDITKNFVRRLNKNKIPLALLPLFDSGKYHFLLQDI
jgi:hypothetical protein